MIASDRAAQAAQSLFSDVSPGWQRWDTHLVEATRASTKALVDAAGVGPGMQVLDVATGTGEPALSIAPLVAPDGHVTAADVSPAMVEFARAKAQRHGVPNVSFRVANAADLPFSEEQFDAITCRMGVMFFPRERSLSELRRVLKAGGRIAFTVWGEYDENPWITAIREPVVRRSRVPLEGSASADPFRYADAGSLASDLRDAGFQDVREEVANLTWSFAGTPEQFWAFQSDLGGAWSRPGWESLSAAEQAEAEAEVFSLLEPYRNGERLDIPVQLNVASATR